MISVNAPDAAVLLIDNEEVVVIEGHARRSIQAGVGCQPAVTTKASSTIACNGINSPPRADLPDALVAGISDEQVTTGVYGNSNGTAQASARRLAGVTAETHSAVAGYRGDGTAMDLADPLVAEVCDKEAAVGVNYHRHRELKARADRCPVVAAEPRSAVARYRGNDAIGNAADTIVECIGDNEIAVIVRNHAAGKVQASAGGCAVVAAEVGCTITGHRGNSAARAYPPDTVVERVGDEKIAIVVDGHCLGDIQASTGGGAVVAAKVGYTVTCHSGDGTGRLEVSDTVVEGVGDEEVVVAIHRHSDGEIQAGAGSRAAVTAIAGRSTTTRYGADDGSAGRQHRKECGIKGSEKDKCTGGKNQTNQ